MGTTFVSIDEKGFWMRDWRLEVWLRLLALHIEDPIKISGGVATQIRDQWLHASRVGYVGCIPVALEEAVSTAEGKALVTTTIRSLLDALKKLAMGSNRISKDALNLLGFESGCFLEDLEADCFSEIGQAFLDLIDGRIVTTASDMVFVPPLSKKVSTRI